MPDEASLDALVAAARTGGSWAFGRLWTLLAPAVHGYVVGRGVPDPDDVTSEVFLAAFRGLGGFDGDGAAFRAWLFTIAHHRTVDAVRRARRHPDLAWSRGVYDPDLDPRTHPSAEDVVLADLDHGELMQALAGLSDDQREVLLLRTVADLRLEEVAAATGRSVGAVKALQHRAVAAMRRRLADPRVSAAAAAEAEAEAEDRRPAPVSPGSTPAMTETR